jgi:hypothetical protein
MSHELHCKFERETDSAVLVTDDDGESIWFPLSQVESMHKDRNNVGTIVVSDWIANQKGLT